MFDRLRRLDQAVRRTHDAFFGRVADLFDRRQIDEDLWFELEELLIRADVGMPTTEYIVEQTKERIKRDRVRDSEGARTAFKAVLAEMLTNADASGARSADGGLALRPDGMTTVLVVGVNGVGKTTTIAKLANELRRAGKSVVLAAGDTFRAAAIDQLKIWGERANVPVVSHQPGADPGAVVFDAWQAADSRRADVLIVDTAGRLQTKFNLMEELRKMRRVLAKQDPTAPQATLLVVDATTGQNALVQAREFQKVAGVTGIILTKVDGTAKGGCIFAVAHELKLPILYLGTGEKIDDLDPFDPDAFVQALLK